MKRPGWLGGKDDPEEGSDDDERPDREDEPKPEAAAERSARRTAAREGRSETQGSSAVRRKLADRVGKTSEEPKPERKDPKGSRDSKRPKRPKERREPVAKEKPEPKDPKASKDSSDPEGSKDSKDSKSKPKAKAGEPAKKLNRPRRQPGSGVTADERRAEGDRDRERDEGDRRGEGRRRRERGKAADGAKRERVGADGERRRGDRDERSGRKRGERDEGYGRKRGEKDGERKRKRGDRPSAGKRARAGTAGFATALKRGAVETRKWAAVNGPKAGRTLLAGLGAVFALFFEVLGFVLNLAFAAWRVVARPVRAVLGALDRGARAASRRLTPARALTIVVGGAAILLALSQYADYRSISIGNGAYADVQSLAPAPETGRLQAGDPHSYVFVPVAIACLLLLAVATIGGRWRACRLIALAGFAAIVVALIVDRPAGLDPGDAALAFEGVKAKLIGGFYAQIAAGVLLSGSSSLLARERRLAAAAEPAPARRSTERSEAKEPRRRRRTTGRGAGPGTEGTARA